MRNFMSVGNVTQAVTLDRSSLTLVLGNNVDMGVESGNSRNGTGKCVCSDTTVKVRNTKTGEVFEITVEDLYNSNHPKKRY